MPDYLLFSISKKSIKNWEVCKHQGLWGAPRLNPTIGAIKPGDQFVVWIGGLGVKARGTIVTAPVVVPEGTPSPWPDGRPYPVRFSIKIDEEFKKPKPYKFPGNQCNELGLITLDLQKGISSLQSWKFNKMLSDVAQLNQPATAIQPEGKTIHIAGSSTYRNRTHDTVQYMLIRLGRAVGCDVWVARNDRSKVVNGQKFSDLTIPALPKLGFEQSTLRIVELIDVLWLKGSAIKAAFEIEHSTGVYSGLLRMSDLVTEQPNTSFELFIVASEKRRDKVLREIRRPTFSRLPKPLPIICKYIPYEWLPEKVASAENLAGYVQYSLIHSVAEACDHNVEP
ncbi:MAG TPA: hypothetical protein VD973_07065 [Symbiobacteriaceae bacterium]|nr:hypothetical protein [Symbiobacteriaceae bacterium]